MLDKHVMDVLLLYYKSPVHRKISIDDFVTKLTLAVHYNQYKLVYDKNTLVGFVMWTYLDDEHLKYYQENSLIPVTKHWNSGQHLFIVDFFTDGMSPIKLVNELHKIIPYRGKVYWRRIKSKEGKLVRRNAFAPTRKITA